MVIYFVIGGLSIYLFIKEKESSGELAGKHLGRDKTQMFIFHLAIGLGAFWSGTLRGIVNSALFFVVILISISNLIIFAALYYVLFGVVKKNFKLNKKELITYLSVVAVDIISSIVSSILTGVVMANTNI